MKKINLGWLTFLLAMFVSVSFVSCSDDDDDKKSDDVSIVGSWRCDFDGGYEVITFESNGTGVWEEKKGGYHDYDSFTYTYDAKRGVLVFLFSVDDIDTYSVVLTATTLTLRDERYGDDVYRRIK